MNWIKKIFDRIGAPTGASIAADVALTAKTSEVETTTIALGGGSAATTTRAGLLLRYIVDNLVAANGMREVIPDTYFAKIAIDTTLTNPPPAPDAENTIVSIAAVADTEFCLRGLWANISSFGTGTTMTFTLWVSVNGTPIAVDTVIVSATGYQNLMDLFGLPEINSASIYVTAVVDVGNTGACSGTYHYASAI